jgi:hypothetical protein
MPSYAYIPYVVDIKILKNVPNPICDMPPSLNKTARCLKFTGLVKFLTISNIILAGNRQGRLEGEEYEVCVLHNTAR